MASRRAVHLAVVLSGLAILFAACSPPAAPATDRSAASPPLGSSFDYQLGGAYAPPAGVEIVARDRTAAPAVDVYSICYINGFQTQPGELDLWPEGLVLRDADGGPLYDPEWPDEAILDTRRADDVAAVVLPWIHGCADAGFDAVEFDNLDTYTRTGGILTRDDNVALARLLVRAAHDAGLAAGQKNAAEDASLLHDRAGFDFAVAEECVAFDECTAYTAVYGDAVLAIEYPDTVKTTWEDVCADPERPRSIVLRDRDLVTPTDPGYLYETC